MEYYFITAFSVGIFSMAHCVGMCGSIIGALTMSLPESVRNDRRRLTGYVLAYNAGRLLSYSVVGAVLGGAGVTLLHGLSPQYGHLILQTLASLILIGIGFYLAGWFPGYATIEKLGTGLWRRLEPLGRRLLPVKSPVQAGLFGVVWGWLPCGLVYGVASWAVTSGGAVNGALVMLAFGLGTLPGVASAGLATGWIVRVTRQARARQIMGILLILVALITLFVVYYGGLHDPVNA